jgi:hypothetical protein
MRAKIAKVSKLVLKPKRQISPYFGFGASLSGI